MALDIKQVVKNSWIWVEISENEYNKLTQDLSDDDISKMFKRTYSENYSVSYYKRCIPDTNELLISYGYENIQQNEKIYKTLLKIQSILSFFFTLTIIGLILSGISFVILIGKVILE